MSDRFGRRGPLLAGLLICVLASAVAALAPSLLVLVAARAVQGFSAAAGMVIARAMISDLATGNAAAKALSLMMVISGIAPVIAPTLGSLLGHLSDWRGILWGLAVFAGALLLLVFLAVKESQTRERRAQLKADAATGPGRTAALRSRVFLGNVFAMAFSAAVMFAYVAASPFFYQGMFGMDPVGFGLMFGATAVVIVSINWYSARLIGRFSVRAILVAGVSVMVVAAFVFLLLVIAGVDNGWLIAALFVAVSFSGAVMPKAAALALAEVRHVAGTGSAVLGTVQFTAGAAVTPLVSLAGEHTALPFAIVLASSATVMGIACVVARPAGILTDGLRRR